MQTTNNEMLIKIVDTTYCKSENAVIWVAPNHEEDDVGTIVKAPPPPLFALEMR